MPLDGRIGQDDGKARGKSILVIDDEPQMLEALSDLLEDDFNIITTTNPADGLDIVQREPSLAAILCDQRMPRMMGDEFLARAKELSIATRVMITGFADMQAVVRAVNEGRIFGYVSKPWDPDGLRVVVHKAVEYFDLNCHLYDERALLRDLMENSPDSIYFKDREHRFLRINRAGAAIMGIADAAAAEGLTERDLLPDLDVDTSMREEAQLFATGEPVIGKLMQLRQGGGVQWFQDNKAPVRDQNGNVTGLVGITRNITAQKNTEEELKLLLRVTNVVAEADSVDEALELAVTAICEATDWEYGEAWLREPESGELRLATGYYGAEEMAREFRARTLAMADRIGTGLIRDVWRTRASRWIPDLAATDAQIARAGVAQELGLCGCVVMPVVSRDECLAVLCFYLGQVQPEEHRWAEITMAVARQAGQVLERKAAEQALRTSEQRFRTLISESAQGVLVLRDMRAIYANRELVKMFGYASAEEVQALGSVLDLVAQETPELSEALAGATARKINSTAYEVHCRHRNGSDMFVTWHIARVPWDDGWATCIHMHDVTEQRRTELQLVQAQKMETVGQLTGGIAHDFNNLLTVIQGNLELMGGRLEKLDDPKLSKWAGAATHAAQRGADLTHRLLAFSRRQVLEPETLDSNETISAFHSMLQRTLGENIEVRLALAPKVSPIRADVSQLESALLNLAVNARDAMPAGGRITIETTETVLDAAYAAQNDEVVPGPYVEIAISDTGGGIPPGILERILEPFFTTKEVGKGTGLGLSMVYGFVKQSSGHLAISSELGQGTTVRLYFPVSGENAGARKEEAGRPASGGSETVLVVDDSEDVRDVAVAMLRQLGFEVLVAENGPTALAILAAQPEIDLLFTDVVMVGGMSGLELAAEARKLRPGLRVLYTSGHSEQVLQPGGDRPANAEWLNKPYSIQVLGTKVRAALDSEE